MKKIKYAAYLLFLVTASFLAVYFCKDISFSDFFSRIFPSSQKEEQEVYIFESLADDAANSPVTNEVQTVRKVRLKQAVAIGEGNAGAFYNNPDYQDVIPVDIDSFSEADIPSKYDSRDVDGKNNVTRVENQGNSYLCWCFSSLSAIECDILKHHDDIDNTELDLSEKHLSYYNLHRTEGSYQGLIDDDYRILINADNNKNDWVFDYDTGYITCGGVPDYCISLLTAWKGPVNEAGNDAFFAVTGSTNLFTKNAEKPSDPYGSEYHVQGVYQIPASLHNMTMIKQMVMEHAGVTVGMDAKDKNWKDHNSYNYSTQGDSPLKTANHEVVIIGWDDDFSASKFRTKPPGDGAWLCKNSWGENMGDEGFFYISYYDETLPIGNATAYHVAMPKDYDWYDNNYQAAGFLTTVVDTVDDTNNEVCAYSASNNSYGMLYKSGGKELLMAIGVMSLDQYQLYEISIYLNPQNEGDMVIPTDDCKVLTQKISAISGGYHSFELDEAIPLNEGDDFFIMIKPATRGRLVYEVQQELSGPGNFDDWQNFTGNILNSYRASGCSFYVSDEGKTLIRQKDKDFFVKAYTINR